MALGLSASEKAVLNTANRNQVVQVLASLKKRTPVRWLDTGNVFPTGQLRNKWPSLKTTDYASVIELIAVSAPNHCIDGWGFLARSLASLICGDMHSARHFAYYAELRAALSILSCAGIGVLDRFNCVIDKSGTLREVDDSSVRNGNPLRTHVMAWLALEHWASGQLAGEAITKAITLRKISFDNSIKAMWPGASTRPAAKDLILAWGVDLKIATQDQFARNISSYTAQALNPLSETPDRVLAFVSNFWAAFEPDSGDPFLILDRDLFRIMAETQHRLIGGNESNRIASLKARYGSLEPSIQAVISEDFLTRVSNKANLDVINMASVAKGRKLATEMISRAALLLRSASGLVTHTLFDAGINLVADLNFWLNPYGRRLGFWGAGGPPAAMSELWVDVQDALNDAQLIRTRCVAPSVFEQMNWSSTAENGFPRLSESERIGLWSLCP